MKRFILITLTMSSLMAFTACKESVEQLSNTINSQSGSVEITTSSASNEVKTADTQTNVDSESSVNPELKSYLDEYETFMNDYVEFMKEYKNSSDEVSMLTEYTNLLSKYSDYTSSIYNYSTDEMSAEDLEYYLDVTSRVTQKLTEIGQ